MKDTKELKGIEKKEKIAEELVPIIEKLTPEKKERVLGYAMGLADNGEDLNNECHI